MDGCRRGRSPFEGLRFPLLRAPPPRGAFSSSTTELNLYYLLTSSSRSMTACPHAFRHTRACGSEWSISKPARALRALRHPSRWLSMVSVSSCTKKCYAGTSRGQEGSPPYTPSASDSRSALRVRTFGSPFGQLDVLTLCSSNSPTVGAKIGRRYRVSVVA